ncbi:aspartate kinase [Calidifontibacillus oryziterrae]|uniref:aspartate kinase n=1 Tax=Calidifontibacillus oryziterrae TaxID=1191699 RepID=UPI0003073A14|nr:aspartate kinase [Calidifontibacillus oryziterrae]
MKIIVQKFGGTSVKDEESRLRALLHVQNAVKEGYKVVVVVSAMGRNGDPYATDTLLNQIDSTKISDRELDLLLSCGEILSAVVFANIINVNGLTAVALTGAQAGFRTNEEHTNAKIVEMRCERIFKEFENHDVVVVAGFQGISMSGEVTTLGRGGSDTSAAALGVAINAEIIDIFTDVEGIMTADPRIVEAARPLSVMTYNEVCNLAHQGAKVIHPRAVEIAMQAKVPLRIRSTYSDTVGTLITASVHDNKGSDIHERVVTGIAHVSSITQITVSPKEGQYNLQAEVFKAMAQAGISVDFINISPSAVIYTVMDQMTERAISALKELGYEPTIIRNCAKVSAVGAGMTGVPGVTAKIVNALSKEGIQILQSADSHTTIWVLVHEEDMVRAVNSLHNEFCLS